MTNVLMTRPGAAGSLGAAKESHAWGAVDGADDIAGIAGDVQAYRWASEPANLG